MSRRVKRKWFLAYFCVAAFFGVLKAADVYYLYWIGDATECAYPTGTTSNTGWVPSAGSAHETLDDGQPYTVCADRAQFDDDTTYLECDAADTTCSVQLALNDPSNLSGDEEIGSVAVWYYGKSANCAGTFSAQPSFYFRINSTNYLACTELGMAETYALDTQCGETFTSPDTSARWTKAELDSMELLITDLGTAECDTRLSAVGVGIGYSDGTDTYLIPTGMRRRVGD